MSKKLKVNKSEVMKKAWELFKMAQKWAQKLTFSECLKRAWATAKKNAFEFIGQVEINVYGTRCTVMTATGYVEGNTFKAKDTLKKFGLEWNSYEKVWEGKHSQLQELCRVFAM